MNLSDELTWRGFVNQTTYPDLSVLNGDKVTFYHGFDASADSQTVGNLAGMMLDRLFMKHGHRGIILAGGATSLIGDPGGKDAERPLPDESAIIHNVEKAKAQLTQILSGYDFKLVNNLDWTKDLKVIDFLRNYGKHFSMTPLIRRDFIATRLGEGGSGISYAEFSYTILQGMDFLHLFETEGATLQLGGSDQWGNCLSGVELIRKTRGKEAHVLTLPLIINKSTGQKFGKTEEGAIWLDAERTSVYQFYQFWLNTEDDVVENYLKIFTELDRPTIETLISQFNENRTSRLAQKTLAFEATKIVHGLERAESVKKISEVLFGGADPSTLTDSDYELLGKELPVVEATDDLPGVIISAGLAASRSEVSRLVEEGAIYINGQRYWTDQELHLKSGFNLLKKGKNQFVIVKEKNVR